MNPKPAPSAIAAQLKQRIGPGLWIDREDNLHFSIPEILEAVDLPDTPENRAIAQRSVHEVMAEHFPQTKLERTVICPACQGRLQPVHGCPRCGGHGFVPERLG